MYLKEHMQIGRGPYLDMRLLMMDYCEFPTPKALTALGNSITPTLHEYKAGIKCNMKEAIKLTITRRLEAEVTDYDLDMLAQHGIVANLISGCDGSGKLK